VSYSYSDLITVARQAGFTGVSANIIAAIAMAESGGDPYAHNAAGDRGILQLNSVWHKEVPDTCAYDVVCSFQHALRISNNGGTFSAWCTAWSDNACGTKGGSYLGTGASYQKWYNQGAVRVSTPDTTGGFPDIAGAIGDIFKPITDIFTIAGALGNWLEQPIRIVKIAVGFILIAIALLLYLSPQGEELGKTAMRTGGLPVSSTQGALRTVANAK
jgi:hypothetical protein